MLKIELAEKRMGEIGRWKTGFFLEEKDRLAIYKALQEVSEACMDIISMMAKDMGKTPEEDYSNISWLAGTGLINGQLKQCLIDLNEIRNRILHEYNGGLDDRLAYDSMEEMLPDVKRFLEVVRKWLEKA